MEKRKGLRRMEEPLVFPFENTKKKNDWYECPPSNNSSKANRTVLLRADKFYTLTFSLSYEPSYSDLWLTYTIQQFDTLVYPIYQSFRSSRIWHKVNFFKRSLTGFDSEFSFS